MKATVVVDNIEDNGICGEWGLCIDIEYEGKHILLDTGASDLFVENAKKLGISLETVDMAVLSHAHYDHGNGMEEFFRVNQNAKFFIQESCMENCYSRKKLFPKYIGLPKGVLHQYKDRLVRVSGAYKLMDGVSMIGHTTSGLHKVGKMERMYQRKGPIFRFDDFSHEQSLVFETEKGLVIFNSCSHAGAYTILEEIKRAYPGQKIYAYIGGFHLHRKTPDYVRDFAKKVKATDISYICTGHCTGVESYEVLKEELGDVIHQLKVGLVMEF